MPLVCARAKLDIHARCMRTEVSLPSASGKAWWVRHLLLRLVRRAPEVIGSPYSFVAAVAIVVALLVASPFMQLSPGWLVLPASLTSIVAFIVVFLIQYSENRDTRVIQIKLDEIIRALEATRTDLVHAENKSDDELDRIEAEFDALRK
jgi:low affinity Fe/Cu permease